MSERPAWLPVSGPEDEKCNPARRDRFLWHMPNTRSDFGSRNGQMPPKGHHEFARGKEASDGDDELTDWALGVYELFCATPKEQPVTGYRIVRNF